MKFLDLFAGIGGFRLAFEQAGCECVGYVEWNKFARKSYEAIHKTEGEWTAHDVRTVRATDIPRADCWCFGFPCQDISVAGSGGGFAGDRSSLFFRVTNLIREMPEANRPHTLLIENVKNFISVNRGLDFFRALVELDKIGYDVEWDVLQTSDVLPQNRERIFLVGHLRGRSRRKVFPIRKNGGTPAPKLKTVINSRNQIDRVYDPTGICPTLTTMQGGRQEPKIIIPSASYKTENEKLSVQHLTLSQQS